MIVSRGLRGLRRGLGDPTIGPPEIDASGNLVLGTDITGGAVDAWLNSLGSSNATASTDPLTAAANAFGNLSYSQASQFLSTLNSGMTVLPNSTVMYAGIAVIAFVILMAVGKK